MRKFSKTDRELDPLDTPAVEPKVREFLLFLATERRLSRNTLFSYRFDLEDAENYFLNRGILLLAADGYDWREYLQSLRKIGRTTKTVARRLACIRTFLKYLEEQGISTQEILGQLESPKPERPLPDVLGREQVARLIGAPDPQSPLYFRDVAILELLYACGLRASELCDLKLPDLNLEVGAIRVIGKGMKERVVPIGNAAIEAMRAYLRDTRPRLERGDAEHVILSRTGKRLNRVNLWYLVRRHARACGLLKEVHPHVLRHCFASHLLGGGADLRTVQELLGHANVATTQIYTHVDQTRLKKLHEQFHPRH